MSLSKRQKVCDEQKLNQICDDSEALFNLVDNYWKWQKENRDTAPLHGQEFKFVTMKAFFCETLGCPTKLADELCAVFQDCLLRGKVFPPYDFSKWFWGTIETWSMRELPGLQITYEVSDALRKRLIRIHDRFYMDGSRHNFDKRYERCRPELATLYWLTPPNWRQHFFRTWIHSTYQVESVSFDPELVIPLLKFVENQKTSIWEEIQRLVLDDTERLRLFRNVTGWINLEIQGDDFLYDHRLKGLVWSYNQIFCDAPDFSSRAIAIQFQDHMNWLCTYVALGLECDVPIWDSLFCFLYYNQPLLSE
jgi:hypothetical protein